MYIRISACMYCNCKQVKAIQQTTELDIPICMHVGIYVYMLYIIRFVLVTSVTTYIKI